MTPSQPTRSDSPETGPRHKLSLGGLLLVVAIVVGYAVVQSLAPPSEPRKNGEAGDQSVPARESETAADVGNSPTSSAAGPSPADADRPANSENLDSSTQAKQLPSAGRAASTTTIVKDVTIRDQGGRIVFRGDIDLTKTLSRIDRGQRLTFPNDGSVFGNRERRLPSRGSGYYREWVHPTPRLSGPGPQRIVTGQQGEAFYTHDHYRTFKKVR